MKQLDIAVQHTKQVLDSGKTESIKRHLQALRETVCETNNCKRAAEEAKIDKNEEIEQTNMWSNEVEAKLEKFRRNRSTKRTVRFRVEVA